MGVRPGRKPRHEVELAQKLGDHLVSIRLGRQAIHLRNDPHESGLDALNRLRRVVLALRLEAAMVLDEFFAVELSEGGCG